MPLINDYTPLMHRITLSVETQKNLAETYTNVNNLLNIDYVVICFDH